MMRKRPTFAATAADLGALRSFDVKETQMSNLTGTVVCPGQMAIKIQLIDCFVRISP